MENDRDTSLQSWEFLTLFLPRYTEGCGSGRTLPEAANALRLAAAWLNDLAGRAATTKPDDDKADADAAALCSTLKVADDAPEPRKWHHLSCGGYHWRKWRRHGSWRQRNHAASAGDY